MKQREFETVLFSLPDVSRGGAILVQAAARVVAETGKDINSGIVRSSTLFGVMRKVFSQRGERWAGRESGLMGFAVRGRLRVDLRCLSEHSFVHSTIGQGLFHIRGVGLHWEWATHIALTFREMGGRL